MISLAVENGNKLTYDFTDSVFTWLKAAFLHAVDAYAVSIRKLLRI